jgi:hypothetical protein
VAEDAPPRKGARRPQKALARPHVPMSLSAWPIRGGTIMGISLVHLWISQTSPVIAISLTLALAGFALFLAWLSFASPLTPFIQRHRGVVPPFVGIPSVLFGLLMTFLSQDVWDANRRAYRALAQEREQLVTLRALNDTNGEADKDLPRALRGYVEAVVGLEWKSMERGEESPEAETALNALTRAASAAKIEPAFQRALVDTVLRLRAAREQRLAVASAFPDDRKWAAVLLLAFITQISLAVVHLESVRPQLAAQAIFAGAAIVAISLVASVNEPYVPPNSVSSDPLEQLLEKVPPE